MSKSYKIKVNQGNGEAKLVDIPQVSSNGQPMAVKAVPGGKYQLVDASTGYGPENIRASRSGQNLKVYFEGRGQPDLVIEDYYKETPEGFNGLIGESESGRFYEYIPETAAGTSAVPLLADGSNQVGMALGGAEINASDAAVGALVAAAGLNPLLLAPLALLGAAGGGGGGGGAADTTAPVVKSAKLHVDDDTGAKDNVTSDKTPRITGETEANASVSVEVNGKTYTGTANASGVFEIQVPDADALKDGPYTPKVTATDAANNKSDVFDGTPFSVDTSADGPNLNATVEILSINDDSGPSNSDFYTNDQTLKFNGEYKKFTPNGDLIKLELKDAQGMFVDTEYVKPSDVSTQTQDGTWTWDRSSKSALPVGKYTLVATVVDLADNALTKAKDQDLTVDITGEKQGSGLVSIISMSLDSGVGDAKHVSRSDFKTNDNTPEFKGKITDSVTDQWLEVRLHNEADGKDTSKDLFTYINVRKGTNEWKWSPTTSNGLPDAKYSLTAKVVDQAGNALLNDKDETIGTSQEVVIDTRGPVGPNDKEIPSDPNEGFVLDGFKLLESLDSGFSNEDFITNAGKGSSKLVFEGNISNVNVKEFDMQAGSVWVQLIGKIDGKVFSEGFATFDSTISNSWKYNTNQDIESDGVYVVRASLLDQASNKVSTMDQILVIDRTISPTIAIDSNISTSGIVSQYLASADEQGFYTYTGHTNSTLYEGGEFNLENMAVNNYSKDNFKLTFSDLAGNSVSVSNNIDWNVTASPENLGKGQDSEDLPKPGFTTTQKTVTGDIGSIKVTGTSIYDMSILYDGIDTLSNPEKGAVNHVDMTSAGTQKIDISIQDILSLGVEGSFRSDLNHKDKVQIRIDGTNIDEVNFSQNSNEASFWNLDKDNLNSLEGVALSEKYWLATNETYGLEVFIRENMTVTGSQINIV